MKTLYDDVKIIITTMSRCGNPNYAFGAELLNFIAPKSDSSKTVRIEVAQDFEAEQVEKNGIVGEAHLHQQIKETQKVLSEQAPGRHYLWWRLFY